MRRGGFLRYLCYYCASRFVYSTVRDMTRRSRQQPCFPATCEHSSSASALGTLLLLMFIGSASLVVWAMLYR